MRLLWNEGIPLMISPDFRLEDRRINWLYFATLHWTIPLITSDFQFSRCLELILCGLKRRSALVVNDCKYCIPLSARVKALPVGSQCILINTSAGWMTMMRWSYQLNNSVSEATNEKTQEEKKMPHWKGHYNWVKR